MPHSSKRLDATSSPSEGRAGERSSASRNNSAQNDDNSPSGRRDENLASLSFRHFLQPHSDVVPTSTTRHGRNVRGSTSIDLVDGVNSSMALPDFVQDHLVLESLASSSSNNGGGGGNNPSGSNSSSGNHHHLEQQGAVALGGAIGGRSSSSSSSLDMSVLSAILPDFTTSQRNQSCLSKRNRRQENSTNGDGACSLPSASTSSSSSSKVALPDFLSDGPMLCSSDGSHHNNNNNNNISSSSPNRSAGASASSLHSSRVAENSDLTAANMDRLRRDLAERNRRLSQLESDFSIARNEATMFETAFLTAQQNLDAANRQINKLKSELASLKDQFNNEKSTRRRDTVDPSTSSTPPTQRNVPMHYTNVDVTALSTMHHYLTESLKELEKIYPTTTGNGIAGKETEKK